MNTLIYASVFGILALNVVRLSHFRKRGALPLPPGPKGLPLVGNIHDLPPHGSREWEHWLKHKDIYGSISSVSTPGNTLIIINDAKVAIDLLEKRSAQYSSRARMIFGSELAGWERMVTMKRNPVHVRGQRRRIHQYLGSANALSSFYTQQDIEARRFLLRALQSPERLVDHIRSQTGATILKIVYGYTTQPHGRDPLVDLADTSTEQFGKAHTPGTWLVDSFPLLRYLPEWVPGAGFQTKAREWRSTLDKLAEQPYLFVQEQMKNRTCQPSYVSKHLTQAGPDIDSEEEMEIKWSAATLYGAGADTTVSALSSFFLAMALFPTVQTKAQEELDCVVGTSLPTTEDRTNLPYINAVIKEVLRWNPVTPLGVAHASTKEDVYEGYRIPKDATIVPNIWAFLHDPEVYSDPMTFNPERFLETETHPAEIDPHNLAFGFGRRICPGRGFADSTIFLTVVRSLQAFRIGKLVRDGREIEPAVDYLPGVISHPKAFEISITPRSKEHELFIRSIEIEHPWDKGDIVIV
ncbi:cytochrome P450 [Aspergillus tubingensis]|uniref:cytochrome P450 n=1 Tax=Aspergillus tubingensis TaxID=5068 RepID=UPI001579E2EA|nr:cytochrome P450 oxidoreductase OrdA-like protein [Aspergillus tubingensis]GFN10642.1 cytochrome P450 oxidoreductase OrdA-like protein [Aspergillus tubingensis]